MLFDPGKIHDRGYQPSAHFIVERTRKHGAMTFREGLQVRNQLLQGRLRAETAATIFGIFQLPSLQNRFLTTASLRRHRLPLPRG